MIHQPTEQIATRLVTHKRLKSLEDIVSAIEYTYNHLSEHHRRLMHTKYFTRERKSWQAVADELHMHRNTAIRYRKDIVNMIALQMGWHE